MSNPVSGIDSSPALYPTLNSNTDSTHDSRSPPNSYVSLLDTSESPG